MLRAIQIVGSNILTGSNDISLGCFTRNSVIIQSIRWKRKPIWEPTAKTKVFRVPKRPAIIEEEVEEIKRLSNNYRTYMKSIKRYIRQSVAESQIQFDEVVVAKAEEKDFIECSAINDEWNKTIALQREKRLAEERKMRENMVMQKLIAKEERDLELKLKIEEHVKHVKLLAPTFITEKNIDEAIQEALSNVVDYNSYIDINGKIYTKNDQPLNKNTVSKSAVQVKTLQRDLNVESS